MTKQLTCPVCGKKKWCRDDAKTCSSNCRVKLWRDKKRTLRGRVARFGQFVAVSRHPDRSDEEYRLEVLEAVKKTGGNRKLSVGWLEK